jgi:hypothetical protein
MLEGFSNNVYNLDSLWHIPQSPTPLHKLPSWNALTYVQNDLGFEPQIP